MNHESESIRGLSTLFYRNRRLTFLAIGLIVVSGLSSFVVLPRMEDPLLTPRAALILTALPGADAEQIEAQVTDVIENELREISEIRELRSESRSGLSTITVELRDDVYSDTAPAVWSRIRDRLADAEAALPAAAGKPRFEELEVTAYTRLLALVWDGELISDPDSSGADSFRRIQQVDRWGVLRRLSEDFRDRLLAVPGTKSVDLFGDPREEILVEIQPDVLASIGLTAGQLARIITDSDARVSAGQLRSDNRNLPIEVSGELDCIDRIPEIPILTTSDGRVVRLRDVADVRRGIADPPDNVAIVDGRPAIVLGCLIRPGQRVDQWTAASEQVVRRFSAELSGGVRLQDVFNQNAYVQDRLETLLINLLAGVGSVVVVIWWLMGWRSALIVGAALPLSSFMVLSGMRVLQIPIHQMSVTGLIIALGLLIDNAIVLVDEVQHRRRHGFTPTAAIEQTVRSLAVPLLGSTLTTALAFAPIALMPGPAGEFVSSISINVILAIFSSLLLSLTIVPALTGFLGTGRVSGHIEVPSAELAELNAGKSGNERIQKQAEASSAVPRQSAVWYRDGWSDARLTRAYERTLEFVLRRPWIGILCGLVIPVTGFILGRLLPEQFFPPADRNQISVELALAPQTSRNGTIETAQRMREELLRNPDVRNVTWFAGRSAPPFYYNQLPLMRGVSHYAQAIVELQTGESVAEIIRPLQRQLDQAFPEARTLVRQLEQGPPFVAPIEVRVKGPDLHVAGEIAESMRAILADIPFVTHVRTESSELMPALTLHVDEDETRVAGLSHQELSAQIFSSLDGVQGGLMLEGTEELPLRVRVRDSSRESVTSLLSLNVLSAGMVPGSPASGTVNDRDYFPGIPLRVFGDAILRREHTSVTRLNRTRINEVQGFVEAGVLPAIVLAEFQSRLKSAELDLPAGYELEFGGESAERDDAVKNLMASIGVLAVLMVATLVLSLRSFRLAGIIGMVALLSAGLGLGSLWLWGWPFGFMAIIGTMGLVGVAINDSIVVLTALNDDPEATLGDVRSVRAVVIRCTRHVAATTLTTIAGFLPLWLGGGQFWPPLAVTIAGGVGGATLLALLFVPSVFVCLRRMNVGRSDVAGDF